MIYMLSQCKDAIDNPAALFARMMRFVRINKSGACSSSDVITNIHFATTLKLPAESPPMMRIRICCVVNFHMRMKRFKAKCSLVQLRANSVIYSLDSRLV